MASEIFIDSDIILDLFLNREPHIVHAQELLNLFDKEEVNLYTSSIIINNVYYFINKGRNRSIAKSAVKLLADILKILPVYADAVELAVDSDFKDFEDALQYYTALKQNCDYIITRNTKDYKHSAIPVLTAEQFLRTIL